jgi:hypothetical protein
VKLRDSSRAGVGQRVADLIGELFGLGPGKKAPPGDGA